MLPLDVDGDPLMRFAVLELIRDMNQTQSGAGGRQLGQDVGPDALAVFTAGRPTLPPYVAGLLAPYMRHATSDGPVGQLPAGARLAGLVTRSAVPATIDALIARLKSAVPSPVRVVDGFPRFTLSDTDVIAVGGTPDPTASGERVPAGMRTGRAEQTFTLQVTCSCSRGISTEQKVARDRAYELLAMLEDLLDADPTLGGVVRSARVAGPEDLGQPSADTAAKGTYADVVVGVLCQASI